MRRFVVSICMAVGAAIALSGCGASQVIDPVARAAAVTASTPGYKMSARMTITGASGPVTAHLKGSIVTANSSGTMSVHEVVAGHQVDAPMIFSRRSFWMRATAVPGGTTLAAGKPWIFLDMNKALGAMGVGSLPTTAEPSLFLDYLSSVGANPTRVASLSINGVPTTKYHAVIDLGRYANLFHPSAQTITALESAIGAHTIPVDAWIDGQNRVRRIHIAFPECVAGTKLHFSMTMGIYGFGPKPQVNPPPRSAVYNLTPTLVAKYANVKPGCTAAR